MLQVAKQKGKANNIYIIGHINRKGGVEKLTLCGENKIGQVAEANNCICGKLDSRAAGDESNMNLIKLSDFYKAVDGHNCQYLLHTRHMKKKWSRICFLFFYVGHVIHIVTVSRSVIMDASYLIRSVNIVSKLRICITISVPMAG